MISVLQKFREQEKKRFLVEKLETSVLSVDDYVVILLKSMKKERFSYTKDEVVKMFKLAQWNHLQKIIKDTGLVPVKVTKNYLSTSTKKNQASIKKKKLFETRNKVLEKLRDK